MGTDLFFKFGDRMIFRRGNGDGFIFQIWGQNDFSQTDAKKNSVPSVRNFGEEEIKGGRVNFVKDSRYSPPFLYAGLHFTK